MFPVVDRLCLDSPLPGSRQWGGLCRARTHVPTVLLQRGHDSGDEDGAPAGSLHLSCSRFLFSSAFFPVSVAQVSPLSMWLAAHGT